MAVSVLAEAKYWIYPKYLRDPAKMSQRKFLIEYELEFSKKKKSPGEAGKTKSKNQFKKALLNPLFRSSTTSIVPCSSEDAEWEINRKYQEWKNFKQQSSQHLQEILDKVDEPVLDPSKLERSASGRSRSQQSPPKTASTMSQGGNTRPSTGWYSTAIQPPTGDATIDSFVRAANGITRDIQQYKAKSYNYNLEQPTWDHRFVYGKGLTPKKFCFDQHDPRAIANSEHSTFVNQMTKYRSRGSHSPERSAEEEKKEEEDEDEVVDVRPYTPLQSTGQHSLTINTSFPSPRTAYTTVSQISPPASQELVATPRSTDSGSVGMRSVGSPVPPPQPIKCSLHDMMTMLS